MISTPQNKWPERSSRATTISIEFVAMEPVPVEIKQGVEKLPHISDKSPWVDQSLFHIAARATWPSSLSTAMAGLAMTRPTGPASPSATETSLQPLYASEKSKAEPVSGAIRSSVSPQPGSKKTVFSLEVPWAKSVKLASDFTEWQQGPLAMTKTENGVWTVTVWLQPGKYSYRFIVDDQWYDDPRSGQRITNAFGTTNTLIHIH